MGLRTPVTLYVACLTMVLAIGVGVAAGQGSQPRPTVERMAIDGATVYSPEDIRWITDIREGSRLRTDAAAVAATLQQTYERDGYTEARVTGSFDEGTLTLHVDEGHLDRVEFRGIDERDARRLEQDLDVHSGDIYNKRTVARAVSRLERQSSGALNSDDPIIEHPGGQRVLALPVHWASPRFDWSTDEAREELFSPVDGFNPTVAFRTTLYDRREFNHALIDVSVSYKVAADRAGFSAGGERPLFTSPKLFLGGDVHDLTATDDRWRLTGQEQVAVAFFFKNTFRDYYRRGGAQVFSVLQAGVHNELSLAARWDRDRPLANETDFSLFRDDAAYRPNQAVPDQHLNAWLLGYRFDTRPLTGAGSVTTYRRHLADDLFGFGTRQDPGLRLEWTSEFAGHGLGGDADFDRHILNTRGYLAFGRRQLFSARALFGFSNGTLPPEREFAIGGIGTVHGYAFKEARGSGMTLLNAEYRVDLTGQRRGDGALLAVFGFYDAGRISGPIGGSRSDWLNGVGFGVSSGPVRVEFGFRANDIPGSRQILVRVGPTF